MPIVLAIEPDRRQAAHLTAVVRQQVNAELVISETTEGALDAIGNRVPDLVLVPALLSPQDDAALAAALRVIAAAAHVRTLTIPLLASTVKRAPAGGMLAKWRRNRAASPEPDGCDPAVFGEQISAYLKEAAAERAQLDEDALLQDAPIEAQASMQIIVPELHDTPKARPSVEENVKPFPSVEKPWEATEQPLQLNAVQPVGEPVIRSSQELTIPSYEELTLESIDELALEKSEGLTLESSATLILEPGEELTLDASEELTLDTSEELALDASDQLTLDTSDELTLDTSEEQTLDASDQLTLDTSDELTLDSSEELTLEASEEPTVEGADPVIDLSDELEELSDAPCVEAYDDEAVSVFTIAVESEMSVFDEFDLMPGILDPPSIREDIESALDQIAAAARLRPAPMPVRRRRAEPGKPILRIVAQAPMAEPTSPPRADITPWVPMYLTPGRIWPQLEGVPAETPTPRTDQPDWIELVASLRQDLERRRTDPSSAAADPVARPSDGANAGTHRPVKKTRTHVAKANPVQDEWGFFDPEQCGFSTLLAKLEEITEEA